MRDKMRLCLDFDGVIHDHKHPVEGRRMGPPIILAKETITALKSIGIEIIIHSVKGEKVIRDWMAFYSVPFDSISIEKPEADFYVDDKGIRFESWNQTLRDIQYLSRKS